MSEEASCFAGSYLDSVCFGCTILRIERLSARNMFIFFRELSFQAEDHGIRSPGNGGDDDNNILRCLQMGESLVVGLKGHFRGQFKSQISFYPLLAFVHTIVVRKEM